MATVLVIDPPWPQRKGGLRSTRPAQGKTLDYKTLGVSEIFALLDAEIFNDETRIVFLWEIDKFLIEAESEMTKRGFKRHARLIWDKGNGVAPAFTVRFSHEYLVWWYKTPLLPIAAEIRGKAATVIRESARQHSRKPDAAYTLIDSLYPNESKMDVFSREKRTGWKQFGDEVGKYGH